MATDVTMPRLSDSMEEGTVLKWLVDEGGEVKRGEPLVEIETDKANMTYEADTDGTLIEIVAEEGDTLAIGEVIARIGEAGARPAAAAPSEGGRSARRRRSEAEEGRGEGEARGAPGCGRREAGGRRSRGREPARPSPAAAPPAAAARAP